jgi:hypothetical protein
MRKVGIGAEEEGGLMKGKEDEVCELDRETASSSYRPICGASLQTEPMIYGAAEYVGSNRKSCKYEDLQYQSNTLPQTNMDND